MSLRSVLGGAQRYGTHVDWVGTAILPFLTSLFTGGFLGWGKPVMTNTAKLKGGSNGLALVALAGPGSNVIMAVILAIVARVTMPVAPGFANFAANGVELRPFQGHAT